MTNRISDEATKHFCEIQPATEPSDVEYYQNFINTRRFTLGNITQFCKVSTGLQPRGSILYLLEGSIRHNSFYFTKDVDVTDKPIFQVDYLYDVWVSEWSALCVDDLSWYAKFQWQASHDKRVWVDIGTVAITEKHNISTSMMSVENAVEWIFPNPEHAKQTKYKYWRAMGKRGKTVDGFINLLLMNIE